MIEVDEENKKILYCAFHPDCPNWKDFEPIWTEVARKYPECVFYDVDATTKQGEAFIKERFIAKSPTVISNEGIRANWVKGVSDKKEFIEKFFNQENTFGNTVTF